MILPFSIAGSCMIFMGAIFGSFFHLTKNTKSLAQHLISGILFATVSVELIPKITHKGIKISANLGFIIALKACLD